MSQMSHHLHSNRSLSDRLIVSMGTQPVGLTGIYFFELINTGPLCRFSRFSQGTLIALGSAGCQPALRGSLPRRISASAPNSEGEIVDYNNFRLLAITRSKRTQRPIDWRLRRSGTMHSASCRMLQAGSLRSPEERPASPVVGTFINLYPRQKAN